MAMIHQELCAVLLQSDRIAFDRLHNLSINHVNLKPARCAFVRADAAAHDERRFLAEMFERVPSLFRYVLLEDDALDDACAVAQLREQKLATRTQVVEPTAQGHSRADVRGEL